MAPRAKAEPTEEVEEQAEEHRFEEFERERPDGAIVRVRRNIDTGEQALTVVSEAPADDAEDAE